MNSIRHRLPYRLEVPTPFRVRSAIVLLVGLLWMLGGSYGQAQTDTTAKGKGATTGIDSLMYYVPGGGKQPRSGGDSAYRSWLYAKIRPIVRLREALRRDTAALNRFLDSIEHTPEAIMRRNIAMAFNPEQWKPTKADEVQRELDIRNSQDWNFIHPPGIAYIAGVKVPLSSIGQALGLTEDVSPVLNYTVTAPENVSIKIYNLAAEQIATVVNALKKPGAYRIEWDMKDAEGRRAPSGDYIAEVIIGNRVAFRKRIVVP